MKRHVRLLLAITSLTFLLMSCAAQQPAPAPAPQPAPPPPPKASPPPARVPFDEGQFIPFHKPGNCAIIGEAFVKGPRGHIRHAAGEQVVLVPVTPFTDELFRANNLHGIGVAERYQKYVRRTVADAKGRFAFRNLPAGPYYLGTYIRGVKPRRHAPKGRNYVYVKGRIHVEPAKTVHITLTR